MAGGEAANVWRPIAIVLAILLVGALVVLGLLVAGIMDLGFSLL